MATKRLRTEGGKDEPVKLNVGGRRFELALQTANAFGYLRARLNAGFSRETDDDGYMFIDRDPSLFEILLQCVRSRGRQCFMKFGVSETQPSSSRRIWRPRQLFETSANRDQHEEARSVGRVCFLVCRPLALRVHQWRDRRLLHAQRGPRGTLLRKD